jgi:molybdenum cofactor cytidylyltransferase
LQYTHFIPDCAIRLSNPFLKNDNDPAPPAHAGRGEIVGLLLAAGASTRFGANKLLHPLPDGRPIALASALALRAALPQMLVVVRPDNAALAQLLAEHGIASVFATNAAEGMGASLVQGVASTMQARGWLIALADMPYVKPQTMTRVADALRNGAAIAVPAHQGQRGHPVGFAARFGTRLLESAGDEGARRILRDHAAEVQQIECGDPGVLADIDYASDLERKPE